jgi:hypothetical protein
MRFTTSKQGHAQRMAAKGHYDGNIDSQVNPDENVSPSLANLPSI